MSARRRRVPPRRWPLPDTALPERHRVHDACLHAAASCFGVAACLHTKPTTPAASPPAALLCPAVPSPARRVERVLKQFERGEVQHVEWLDRLALRVVEEARGREQQRRVEEAEQAAAGAAPSSGGSGDGSSSRSGGGGGGRAGPGVAPGQVQVQVELPSFPRAVIYQQASVAGHSAGIGAAASTATADAIGTPLAGAPGGAPAPGAATTGGGAAGPLILLHDAEVGRENPAEAKAAKLARSLTRGLVDKKLKPDTEERRRIEAVLDYPPNRWVGWGGGEGRGGEGRAWGWVGWERGYSCRQAPPRPPPPAACLPAQERWPPVLTSTYGPRDRSHPTSPPPPPPPPPPPTHPPSPHRLQAAERGGQGGGVALPLRAHRRPARPHQVLKVRGLERRQRGAAGG